MRIHRIPHTVCAMVCRLCPVRVCHRQPGRHTGEQAERGGDQGSPGVRLQHYARHRKISPCLLQ
jgi:hypothetical protein